MGEITCTWFPKTLVNALKVMGEMACTWFPKKIAFNNTLTYRFFITMDLLKKIIE